MAHRRDEEPRTWFRSERVFRVDSEWFIHTREGIAVGPYPDKFAADVDAEMLKSLLVSVGESEALGIIRQFMVRDAEGDSSDSEIDSSTDQRQAKYDPKEVANLLDDGLEAVQAF